LTLRTLLYGWETVFSAKVVCGRTVENKNLYCHYGRLQLLIETALNIASN